MCYTIGKSRKEHLSATEHGESKDPEKNLSLLGGEPRPSWSLFPYPWPPEGGQAAQANFLTEEGTGGDETSNKH